MLLLMMISPQLVLGRLLKPIPTPRTKYGNSGHVEGRLVDCIPIRVLITHGEDLCMLRPLTKQFLLIPGGVVMVDALTGHVFVKLSFITE